MDLSSRMLLPIVIHLIATLSFGNCINKSVQETHQTGINWDLTVSLGNSLQLIYLNDNQTIIASADTLVDHEGSSRNNILKTIEIPLPLPNNINSSLIVPMKTLNETWTKYVITSLAWDGKTNKIYYSHFYENVTNLGYYDTVSKENWILYQTLNGTIYYMDLYKETLYFTTESTNSYSAISRLNLGVVVGSSLPLREEIIKFHRDTELCGLVIDEPNHRIYWSTYEKRPGKSSGVYSMDLWSPVLESSLLFDNSVTTRRPHALTLSNDWIYFINTPSVGVKNRIERVNIQKAEREEVVSITNHFPFMLSILCNDLYFTDMVSKALFVAKNMSGPARRLASVSDFSRTSSMEIKTPYALHAMSTFKYCQEKKYEAAHVSKEIAPSIPTPIIPIVAPSNSGSVGEVVEYHVRLPGSGPKECKEGNCSDGSICIELNEQRYCICQTGKYGKFCEMNIEEIVSLKLAQQDLNSNSSSMQTQNFIKGHDDADDFSWVSFTPLCIMTIISSILIIVVIFLGIKVRRLSAKPRIKRRFIVQRRQGPAAYSNPNNQSTVSSTGTGSQVSNVCEMIDIENCCNMNVCETPCYDQIPGVNPEDKDLLIPV